MGSVRKALLVTVCGGLAGLTLQAGVASAQSADNSGTIEEVTVTTSRLPANLATYPGTVTVVTTAEMEKQMAVSNDLGQILAQAVPALGPSSKDGNNYAQTLRGRKPVYFIDGIPQSADLRGGGRDLRILDPHVIQSVEVVHGATSIYGLGGSGGVINYITKGPSGAGVEFNSDVGVTTSLTRIGGRSLGYSATQSVSASGDGIYFVGSAGYTWTGLSYDSGGDAVPPNPSLQTGIADLGELSLFGKLGVELSSKASLELMALHYKAKQDSEYITGQGDFAKGIKSKGIPDQANAISLLGGAIKFSIRGGEPPTTRNDLYSAALNFDDVLGGTARIQAFNKQTRELWTYYPFFAFAPTAAGFPPNGSQLVTNDEKTGVRVDFNTPLDIGSAHTTLLWGGEYTNTQLRESLTDGRARTSKLTEDNYALFAQARMDVNEWLHISGGVRYDKYNLNIPSFQSIDYFSGTLTHTVLGDKLNYSSVTGNFGAVADLPMNFSVFGSWSRGYSIGNVTRAINGLRPSKPGKVSVTYDISKLGLLIKPVIVDNYEAGLRYNTPRINANLTVFMNRSDLGSSYDTNTLQLVRAPEKIWGLELSGSVNIQDDLRAGGSFTIMNSRTDPGNTGSWTSKLDFSRVPPPLLKAYVEYDLPWEWTGRLQATHLFNESRFKPPYTSFHWPVEGHTTLDLLLSGPAGPGRLSIGVENLLNTNYYPLNTYLSCYSNILINAICGAKAPGATMSVHYSLKY